MKISNKPFEHDYCDELEDPASHNTAESSFTVFHNFDNLLPDKIRWITEFFDARQKRSKYVEAKFLKDPAWDVLLYLFLARCHDAAVRVTSACLIASSSVTTGLRWLGELEQAGYIERVPDQKDGRASFVRLTMAGWNAVNRYLDDVLLRKNAAYKFAEFSHRVASSAD